MGRLSSPGPIGQIAAACTWLAGSRPCLQRLIMKAPGPARTLACSATHRMRRHIRCGRWPDRAAQPTSGDSARQCRRRPRRLRDCGRRRGSRRPTQATAAKKGSLSSTPSRQYGWVPGSGNFGSLSMLIHPSGSFRPVSQICPRPRTSPCHLEMNVHQDVGFADEYLSAHHELEVGLEPDEAYAGLRLSMVPPWLPVPAAVDGS